MKRSRARAPDLSKLREDTRHEQFFFDAPTIDRLVALTDRAKAPLLVCLPSVAVALADRGTPARLLDRDKRFHALPHARDFDLHQPDFLEGQHDLLLCDPPFANVTLPTLRSTIELLTRSAMAPTNHPAIGLAYISSREAALKQAFAPWDLQAVGPPLGYRSVADRTQERIRLYLSRGARSLCAQP